MEMWTSTSPCQQVRAKNIIEKVSFWMDLQKSTIIYMHSQQILPFIQYVQWTQYKKMPLLYIKFVFLPPSQFFFLPLRKPSHPCFFQLFGNLVFHSLCLSASFAQHPTETMVLFTPKNPFELWVQVSWFLLHHLWSFCSTHFIYKSAANTAWRARPCTGYRLFKKSIPTLTKRRTAAHQWEKKIRQKSTEKKFDGHRNGHADSKLLCVYFQQVIHSKRSV